MPENVQDSTSLVPKYGMTYSSLTLVTEIVLKLNNQSVSEKSEYRSDLIGQVCHDQWKE